MSESLANQVLTSYDTLVWQTITSTQINLGLFAKVINATGAADRFLTNIFNNSRSLQVLDFLVELIGYLELKEPAAIIKRLAILIVATESALVSLMTSLRNSIIQCNLDMVYQIWSKFTTQNYAQEFISEIIKEYENDDNKYRVIIGVTSIRSVNGYASIVFLSDSDMDYLTSLNLSYIDTSCSNIGIKSLEIFSNLETRKRILKKTRVRRQSNTKAAT